MCKRREPFVFVRDFPFLVLGANLWERACNGPASETFSSAMGINVSYFCKVMPAVAHFDQLACRLIQLEVSCMGWGILVCIILQVVLPLVALDLREPLTLAPRVVVPDL